MNAHLLHKLTHIVLLAMALSAAGARAEDPATPIFSYSGFGTVGLVHSSEDKADFTSSLFKPNGPGHSHDWSADVDSLIAAQVTANLTPELSAVLQVVSEQNYDDTYQPHVEWADLKYQLTPDLSVRGGRSVLPIFMVSEFRKVGYANPWVRPPVEVYGMVPVTSNDGVDLSYRAQFGAATSTFQIAAGQSDSKLPDATAGTLTAKARDILILTDTFEHGFATVRLAYLQLNLTIPELAPLIGAFRQFGPQGMAIADRYEVNDNPVTVLNIGASYNPGSWFVTGEWSTLDSDSKLIGEKSAWYVSGGHRFGRFTPYLTYAQAKADTLSDPGLDLSAVPPDLAGSAAQLNGALNSFLSTHVVQNTVSVGGRWELTRNAAFKLQYDHTRVGAGSSGVLRNPQPGFELGGKVDVFSVAMDFVF
jgi:hypothetical protein